MKCQELTQKEMDKSKSQEKTTCVQVMQGIQQNVTHNV